MFSYFFRLQVVKLFVAHGNVSSRPRRCSRIETEAENKRRNWSDWSKLTAGDGLSIIQHTAVVPTADSTDIAQLLESCSRFDPATWFGSDEDIYSVLLITPIVEVKNTIGLPHSTLYSRQWYCIVVMLHTCENELHMIMLSDVCDHLGCQGRCRTLSYELKNSVITVCALSGFSHTICEYCSV